MKSTDLKMKYEMNKKIILFGTGKISKTYTEILNRFSIKIKGYVDNDPKKWGTYFWGKQIHNPNILKNLKEIIIVIACGDMGAVTSQLYQMGVDEKIVPIDYVIKDGIKSIEVKESRLRYSDIKNCRKRNIILDNLDGIWGGAEDWVHTVAFSLLKKNYCITVIENEFTKSGKEIEQYTLKMNNQKKKVCVDLIDILIHKKPLTVFNVWNSDVLWAASYLKRLYPKDVQIISCVLNDQMEFYKYQCIWDEFIDLYLCISSRIKNNLVHLYNIDENKVCYKEPFVKNRNETERNYYTDYRHQLKIGYPCRLERVQKRADLLPEIIEKLEQKNIDYILNIAGDGSCLEEITKYIKVKKLEHKVKFYGRLTRTELICFLGRQDIYLNFSEFEGTSLTMLEAMKSGCVPVVTNVSGVEDFIEHRVNGMISDIGDIEAIADSIEYLEKHRNMLDEFSRKCVDTISDKCNIKNYIDYVERLICE